MAKEVMKTIAANKKAYHDYFVEESMEAGIELTGTEVKSLRQGGRAASTSRMPGAPSMTGKCGSKACTSAPMKREICLTAIPCGCAGCCSTNGKSGGCMD